MSPGDFAWESDLWDEDKEDNWLTTKEAYSWQQLNVVVDHFHFL